MVDGGDEALLAATAPAPALSASPPEGEEGGEEGGEESRSTPATAAPAPSRRRPFRSSPTLRCRSVHMLPAPALPPKAAPAASAAAVSLLFGCKRGPGGAREGAGGDQGAREHTRDVEVDRRGRGRREENADARCARVYRKKYIIIFRKLCAHFPVDTHTDLECRRHRRGSPPTAGGSATVKSTHHVHLYPKGDGRGRKGLWERGGKEREKKGSSPFFLSPPARG